MNAQLLVGIARGSCITALVALATFGALYGTGADARHIVSGVIAAAVPVAAGFLGYAGLDASRASKVARGDLSRLHDADVGADLARAFHATTLSKP